MNRVVEQMDERGVDGAGVKTVDWGCELGVATLSAIRFILPLWFL